MIVMIMGNHITSKHLAILIEMMHVGCSNVCLRTKNNFVGNIKALPVVT